MTTGEEFPIDEPRRDDQDASLGGADFDETPLDDVALDQAALDEAARFKEELENALPFDIHLWSDSLEVDALTERIAAELKESGALQGSLTNKRKKNLKIILLNLFNANSIRAGAFVHYSRNGNHYSIPQRYNELGVGFDPLKATVDALRKIGYIGHKMGVHYPETGTKWESRMWATKKLLDLMIREFQLLPDMIVRDKNEELIILRDDEKRRIDYPDTPGIDLMRKKLKLINEMISSARIELSPEGGEMPTFDPKRKRLRRIFNNGTFKDGGRFYHGWWQEIPREYRQYILINGERTVEYDYSAFHITLLYAKEGIDYEGDPYSYADSDLRGLLKLILLIFINAKKTSGRSGAVKAIRKQMSDQPERYPKVENLDKVVDDFLNHHKAIEDYFYSGQGVKLQKLDSRIAEDIMLGLWTRGIVTLPIHDSFRTTVTHAKELLRAMETSFLKIGKGINFLSNATRFNVPVPEVKLSKTLEDIRIDESHDDRRIDWRHR